MIILPAIDIKERTCVRLYQGAFDTVHKVAEDPLETARAFEATGASWIHMVDLDGALQGKAVNADIFLTIAQETSLKVELGGGIRTLEQIDHYLKNGIDRVILGSIALQEPELVDEAVRMYGDAIAVGIDCRNGYAKAEGWLADTEAHFLELAREMAGIGVHTLIYTDIARDGTLQGPALSDYKELLDHISGVDIIASGGVRDLEDIRALRQVGVQGAICGKSIYEGTLDLGEALAVAEGRA